MTKLRELCEAACVRTPVMPVLNEFYRAIVEAIEQSGRPCTGCAGMCRGPGPADDCAHADAEVSVAGDRLEGTIAGFEHSCLVCIREEQESPAPRNHLIAVLCNAVRLAREYTARASTLRIGRELATEGA